MQVYRLGAEKLLQARRSVLVFYSLASGLVAAASFATAALALVLDKGAGAAAVAVSYGVLAAGSGVFFAWRKLEKLDRRWTALEYRLDESSLRTNYDGRTQELYLGDLAGIELAPDGAWLRSKASEERFFVPRDLEHFDALLKRLGEASPPMPR